MKEIIWNLIDKFNSQLELIAKLDNILLILATVTFVYLMFLLLTRQKKKKENEE